ncbi:MAG: tetratricopeptide repeat protein, partial [Treponema sp.]|nr:tetratricopeptide repeat protein [Treponema sp.]
MKRSSKKYRNPEKKARKNRSKKMLATGMMICLGTLPVWCDDEVLLTIFPSAGKALGSYADVQADFGVGAKLTWRRNENLDLFVEGDYKNLTLPNVSSATLINGGVGAGYHLPINDRWGVNLSAQVGGYRASKSEGVLTGLSGGISVSMTYRINPTISVEAGAAANHFVAKPEPLLTDVGATAGLTVNLTRAFTDTTKIKMETREIQPVFPVLYSWYKNNSFASVGITNEEDTAIDNVKVSFYQPQYMSQPNLCATIEKLGKGETFDAELTAFFNERMLDLTEKTNTEASVIIEYSYLGQKRKKTIAMVVPVYGRNSMSWDDDRRASVFVSSKDPAALMFSKYISSIVRDNVRMGISHNIQYAMGIFETLDQFGINYVIDPSSAYSDNVGSTSIDFLQFPYQTLTYRGGDCDDLSILTCSLFEAVGIKTAFITIPGHIFIAFDSGLSMKEAEQSLMNTSNLIDRNGQAWVPLEITLTDEGFSRAWRTGAREWNQANANGTAAFYAMEDSWKIYDPVSVPGANANFTMPEKEVVSRLFQHSMDQWIAREISPVVAKYNALLARHDSDEIRNELGILYGQYGLFVEADDQFKRARRRGYLPSLLNTANVYFARQQYTIALEWYKKVLDEDPRNELAILGIARCNYELENYDECDAAFDVVRNMNPSLAAEYTYLGAFEQTVGRSFSLADRIALTKWDRGNYFSGMVNDSDGSNADGMFDNEDANGFVIAETNPTDSEKGSGGEADSLLAQLTNMNDPDAILKPDAVIKDEKKEAVLPKNKYAEMDDIENLVEELPGLLAQLKIPEANLDSPKPVTVGYEMVAQTPAAETPVIEERRTIPVKEAEPARDLSSLINKSKLEPKSQPAEATTQTTPAVAAVQPTTAQPEATQTPAAMATATPTIAQPATVQPTTVQTPAATVATAPTVTQPTIVQTPVTVTPAVAVTQPTIVETPVEVAQAGTVTPTTVVETPVTVAQTGTVVQPTIAQPTAIETPAATVTTTPTVVQPTVVTTQTTPAVAVTQPAPAQPTAIETPAATVTTTPTIAQPTAIETPAATVTTTPTVVQPTEVTTQTTPAVAAVQPTTAQPEATQTPAAMAPATPTIAQPATVQPT